MLFKKNFLGSRFANFIMTTSISALLLAITIAAVLLCTPYGIKLLINIYARASRTVIVTKNIRGSLIGSFEIDELIIADKIYLKSAKGHIQTTSHWQTMISIDHAYAKIDSLVARIPKHLQNDKLLTLAAASDININMPIFSSDEALVARFHINSQPIALELNWKDQGFTGELTSPNGKKWSFYKNENRLTSSGNIMIDNNDYTIESYTLLTHEGFNGHFLIKNPLSDIHGKYNLSAESFIWDASFEGPYINGTSKGELNQDFQTETTLRGKRIMLADVRLDDWTFDYTTQRQNTLAFTARKVFLGSLEFEKFQSHSHGNILSFHQSNTHIENILYQNNLLLDQVTLTSITTNQQTRLLIDSNKRNPFHMVLNVDHNTSQEYTATVDQLIYGKQKPFDHPLKHLYFSLSEDKLSITSSLSRDTDQKFHFDAIYHFQKNFWAQLDLDHLPLSSLPKSWLQTFQFSLNDVDGDITGSMTMSLTDFTKPPLLQGKLSSHVKHAQVHQLLPNLPANTDLNIANTAFNAEFVNANLNIEGKGKVNQGDTTIKGTIPIFNRQEASLFTVDAKNVTFAQPNDGQITLDSQLQLHYLNNNLHTKGSANITKALYRNTQWQTANSLPEETVIIHHEKTVQSEKNASTSFDIKINFDKRCSIHAFGFHGNIYGDLQITKQPGPSSPIAKGAIHMDTGILTMFGQQLPLNQSRLSWFQSLLTKPHVDIHIEQSVINNDMQKYGIRVLGDVSDLNVEFHSSPKELSKLEIITHLLSSKRNNTNTEYAESIDDILTDLNYHKMDGNDISKVLDILSSLKKSLFFDQVEFNNALTDDYRDPQEQVEVTLTRMLNERFSFSMKLNSSNPRKNRFGFDALLSEKLKLRSYFSQSHSTLGFEIFYQDFC